MTALSEMAVFNPEEFYGGAPGTVNPHAEGVCRMLQELGYQYDLVDSESDYSQYRLLLLADNIPVDHKLECRLKEFMDQGGALIVMGEAGLKIPKKHLQRIALEFGGMVSLSMMQIIFMQRGY